MFCTKCGEKAPDDAKFCESCGAKIATIRGGGAPHAAAAGTRRRQVRLWPVWAALVAVLAVGGVIAGLVVSGTLRFPGMKGDSAQGLSPATTASTQVGPEAKPYWNATTIYAWLDAHYPEWKMPQVDGYTLEHCFTDEKLPDGRAYHTVQGDFNGDGVQDYAIGINTKHRDYAIAFLSPRDAVVLPTKWVGAVMILNKKGGKYNDLETSSTGTFKTDAITMVACESATHTFVYRDGKFQELITSD